jgi:hypothetical protein
MKDQDSSDAHEIGAEAEFIDGPQRFPRKVHAAHGPRSFRVTEQADRLLTLGIANPATRKGRFGLPPAAHRYVASVTVTEDADGSIRAIGISDEADRIIISARISRTADAFIAVRVAEEADGVEAIRIACETDRVVVSMRIAKDADGFLSIGVPVDADGKQRSVSIPLGLDIHPRLRCCGVRAQDGDGNGETD